MFIGSRQEDEHSRPIADAALSQFFRQVPSDQLRTVSTINRTFRGFTVDDQNVRDRDGKDTVQEAIAAKLKCLSNPFLIARLAMHYLCKHKVNSRFGLVQYFARPSAGRSPVPHPLGSSAISFQRA